MLCRLQQREVQEELQRGEQGLSLPGEELLRVGSVRLRRQKEAGEGLEPQRVQLALSELQ